MDECKHLIPRPKVVLWDVHNTLIVAPRGDLHSLIQREKELRTAFELTVANFGLRMDAAKLHDLVLRCIQAEQETLAANGIRHPEIRIDEVWYRILEKIAPHQPATLNYAREVALFFERKANPKTLMPGAFDTLTGLKQRGLRQGIVSNAQFYTPIELGDLLRDESDCSICSYESIFELRLVFFSYILGVSKPDLAGFQRAVDTVAADGIAPAECLMVGDSLEHDILPARERGMQTVWFAHTTELPDTSLVSPSPVVIHDLRQLLQLV